jgi:hypothetical protein
MENQWKRNEQLQFVQNVTNGPAEERIQRNLIFFCIWKIEKYENGVFYRFWCVAAA